MLEHPRSIEMSLKYSASDLWRNMEDCKPLQNDDRGILDPELADCLQTEIEVKCHIRTNACSCKLVACENQVDGWKMNCKNVETIACNGISSGRSNWNCDNVETLNGTLSGRSNCLENQRQSIELEPLATVELFKTLVRLTSANCESVNNRDLDEVGSIKFDDHKCYAKGHIKGNCLANRKTQEVTGRIVKIQETTTKKRRRYTKQNREKESCFENQCCKFVKHLKVTLESMLVVR